MTSRRKEREAQYREVMEVCNNTIARLCRARYPLDEYLYNDLFAEVALCVWNKLHLFKHESDIKTWVYRLTVNTANNHYRRQASRPATVPLDSVPEELLPCTDDESEELERRRACMYRLIEQLSSDERELLTLYFEHLSTAEIAASLNISPTNVTTRINRIQNKLIKMHQDGKDRPRSEISG